MTDKDMLGLIEPKDLPQAIRPKRTIPGRRLSPEELAEVQEKIALLAREYNISIGGCGCCGSPVFEYVDEHGRLCADEFYSVGNASEEKEVEDDRL